MIHATEDHDDNESMLTGLSGWLALIFSPGNPLNAFTNYARLIFCMCLICGLKKFFQTYYMVDNILNISV